MVTKIRQDIKAHGGDWGVQEFWAAVAHCFGRSHYQVRPALIPKFFSLLYKAAFKLIQFITGNQLSCAVEIGRNFLIDQVGGIVSSGYANFWSNCHISNGVVVGFKRKHGPRAPMIGNEVDIGAGAKVLGSISIDNNVAIGANALVIADVPNHCIAAGVPAFNKPRRS